MTQYSETACLKCTTVHPFNRKLVKDKPGEHGARLVSVLTKDSLEQELQI